MTTPIVDPELTEQDMRLEPVAPLIVAPRSHFNEVSDPVKVSAKVNSELERLLSVRKDPEKLIQRYSRPALNGGWRVIDLEDYNASVYHAPAITREARAVVVSLLGCESSALLSAEEINNLRSQGCAFLTVGRVNLDACPNLTEQYDVNLELSKRMLTDPGFPLHTLYNTKETPLFILTESAGGQTMMRNLLDPAFANRIQDMSKDMNSIVTYFDAVRFSTEYPLSHEKPIDRFLANAKRHAMSAGFGLYRGVYGKTMLGTGPIDSRYSTPTSRSATVEEGRYLALRGKEVMREYKTLQGTDHPALGLSNTFWIANNDQASCPDSIRHMGELTGALVVEVDGDHQLANKILPQIGRQILSHPETLNLDA